MREGEGITGQRFHFSKRLSLIQTSTRRPFSTSDAAITPSAGTQKLCRCSPTIFTSPQNPRQDYFFAGRTYLSLGNNQKAALFLKEAVRRHPGFSTAKSLLGTAFLRMKRPDIAVRYFEEAYRAEPENPSLRTAYLNGLFILGLRRFHQGRFEQSKEILELILSQGYETLLVHLHLGIIERELGNERNALHHYEESLKYIPDDPIIRLQYDDLRVRCARGGANRARKAGTPQAGGAEPTDPKAIDRSLSTRYFEAGQFGKAIHFAKRILRVDPQDFEIRLVMAESYRNLGDLEKSKNHFLRAIEIDKNRVEPRYGLSACYWLLQEYQEMLDELRRIIRVNRNDEFACYYLPLCMDRLNHPYQEVIPLLLAELRKEPEDPYLSLALASLYRKSGNPKKAVGVLRTVLQKKPDLREAHLCLITIYREGGIDSELALAFDAYLARFPDDTDIRRQYAALLVKTGQYGKAIPELIRLTSETQQDLRTTRLLAFCYRSTKDFQRAALLYRQLLQKEPLNPEILFNYSYCLEHSGKRANAIELLKNAAAHIRGNAEIHLISGVMLFKENRFEEALKSFRTGADLDESDPRIFYNIGLTYKRLGLEDFAERYLRRAETMKKKADQCAKKK